MSGTVKGGKAASATNRLRFGEDYYIRLGAKGGKASNTGGFASKKVGQDGLTGKQRAQKYGQVGGRISKRLPKYPKSEPYHPQSIKHWDLKP